MMPAPPKVCPLNPVPVPAPDPVSAPVVVPVVVAVAVPPLALFASCGCAALLFAFCACAAFGSGAAGGWLKKLLAPVGLFPPPRLLPPGSPFPPLGPVPAIVEPASGTPKKPMAVGALFWPNLIGFQSSLPVVGSMNTSCAGSGCCWSSPAHRRWADRPRISCSKASRRGCTACRAAWSPTRGRAESPYRSWAAATASAMVNSASMKMTATRMYPPRRAAADWGAFHHSLPSPQFAVQRQRLRVVVAQIGHLDAAGHDGAHLVAMIDNLAGRAMKMSSP
jgi:hypothetical protein